MRVVSLAIGMSRLDFRVSISRPRLNRGVAGLGWYCSNADSAASLGTVCGGFGGGGAAVVPFKFAMSGDSPIWSAVKSQSSSLSPSSPSAAR